MKQLTVDKLKFNYLKNNKLYKFLGAYKNARQDIEMLKARFGCRR
ncbi:hypothetical protein ME784_18140 [Lactobacillus delbrueckii]|nr:hypothetical protein ME784_18140 [Lactobacillus delbrueckii]GHN23249.1 hypothetical protein ME785_18070 [Lactobacillus delbrueckii]